MHHQHKSAEEIIKVENAIPQIVTHKEFKRVQEKLNSRRNAYINNTKELYLLSGKFNAVFAVVSL